MIEYKQVIPDLHAYKSLFESTGWTASIPISEESLVKAMNNSWFWAAAFDGPILVGIGRLISDGALYALISDMIVLPEYQGQGIGSEILKMMKEKCLQNGIRRVWLMAAPGKSEFYLKNGFAIRPKDAPGMQMIKEKQNA